MSRNGGARFTRSIAARALADGIAAIVAVGSTLFLLTLNQTGQADFKAPLLLGLVSATIVVGSLAWKGLYFSRNTVLSLFELRSVLVGAAIAGAVFLATVLVVGLFDGDPRVLALATLSLAPALLVERRIMAGLRASERWLDGDHQRTLVYGYNDAARLLMKKIVQAPEAGRELIGFVDDFVADGTEVSFRVTRSASAPFRARLVGRTADLVDLVREHRVTEILVSSPDFDLNVISNLEDAGGHLRVRWGIAAHLGNVRPDELVVEDLGAIPVLRPVVPSPHLAYRGTKRVFDIVVASAALVLSAPLWLVIAVAIRLESGSPVFFRQERVGLDGRRFVLFKFRSLRADTDPYQSSTTIGGHQATRLGRILRATTLDELPQLLNVLRGDMSLVGPRPEMPFLVEGYTEVQARRLTVKPGITGVWQLSADRHGMEIHENIEFDLFYIAHRSFLLDLVILFETAVFTASALIRAVGRRGQPKVEESFRRGVGPSDVDGEYVLVALDQRGASGLREIWAEVAESLQDRPWPVKVMASDQNIGVWRSILEDVCAAQGLEGPVQFVPYRNQTSLQSLMGSARLVITDLEQFSRMSRAIGTEVLELPRSRKGPPTPTCPSWPERNPARAPR